MENTCLSNHHYDLIRCSIIQSCDPSLLHRFLPCVIDETELSKVVVRNKFKSVYELLSRKNDFIKFFFI